MKTVRHALLERAAENAFQNKDIRLANALYDRIAGSEKMSPSSEALEAWCKARGLKISKIQVRDSLVKGTLSKSSIAKLLSLKSTLPGWKLTEGYGTPGKDNYAWSTYEWNDPEYGPMRMHHERSRASVPSYIYMDVE